MASWPRDPRAAGRVMVPGPKNRRRMRRCLNRRAVLCVIVDNGDAPLAWPCSGVRMRRFGELEAVIMDRLWEWGRPALVREMVDALHDDRALAYTTVMT